MDTPSNIPEHGETTLPLCTTCHQPLQSEYYFCPNCGTQAHQPPLSTSIQAQLALYGLSVVLPMFCFLFIGKWKALAYCKSQDPKARQIGIYACILLGIATIITIWVSVVEVQKIVATLSSATTNQIDGY
jgi:uncharacterized membrane protein YccF (DUF307 family)